MLLAMLSLLALGFISQITHADSVPQALGIGTWSVSTNYPTNISAQSCSISNSYIYCVGGFNGTSSTNTTYFAQITSSGIGDWTHTTPYPFSFVEGACTAYQNYIYCVGGISLNDTVINQTFYAPISASGIGKWIQTSGYPTPIGEQSCGTYNGNIYCVGGSTPTNNTNKVYFAGLGADGVGSWGETNPYPINIDSESCVVDGDYLYCLGGIGGSNPSRFLNNSYYTMLTAAGVSGWLPTTPYPNVTSSQSCVPSNNNIYCTGGYRVSITPNYTTNYTASTFYAPLNSSGIGSWLPTTSYPYSIVAPSCNSYNNYIYCVGGTYSSYDTDTSIIAPVINPNTPTTTATPATTIAQVSNGNVSQPSTISPTPQPPSPNQGNGLVYLIIVFLVILIFLMLLALYLFNMNKSANKK